MTAVLPDVTGVPAADRPPLPRVLLVDDEQAVLDGLRRQLRGHADVSTATSGAQALAMLATCPPATIVSDMQMPGMDGAELLSRVHEQWPDTTRLLLTGQADLSSAMAAVNEGRVFRFLLKPIPPDDLRLAVSAGVRQHELVTAERQLLEETLKGAVQALTDVLSLAHPPAFARGTRVRRLVSQLVEVLELPGAWQIEVAGMLSQLGAVLLPAATLERLNTGQELLPSDNAMLFRLPFVSERLLTDIPRMDEVRAAVRHQRLRFDGRGAAPSTPTGTGIPLGARVLRLALDTDVLLAQGLPPPFIVAELSQDRGAYDPDLLARLQDVLPPVQNSGHPVRVAGLRPGMVLAQDVTTSTGVLLVSRGNEVTPALIERLRNHADAIGADQPVLVDF